MEKVFAGICGALGVASISLCVVGVALAYARVLSGLTGFAIFALGLVLGVASTFAGLVILYRSGMAPAAGMALLGLPPAAFLVFSIIDGRDIPAINDITTDPVYPPAFRTALEEPSNQGRDMDFPVGFKSVILERYPGMKPLAMRRNVDDVFAKAMDLAKDQEGWEITATRIAEKESTFEGHATTRVFGFVDDFVVRISSVEGGCVVDMRSKSRDGKGDLGANAARIEAFFAKLTAS